MGGAKAIIATVTSAGAMQAIAGGVGVKDSEDTLLFSQLHSIATMNEILPLADAHAAYERMMSGKARFRVILGVDS